MKKYSVKDMLDLAVEAHRLGSFADADRYYSAILKEHPHHPDANHNMGVLKLNMNETDQSITYFQTAISSNPLIGQFYISMVEALKKLKKYDDAIKVISVANQNKLIKYTPIRFKYYFLAAIKLT